MKDVIEATHEESRRRLCLLPPSAITALEKMIEDKSHRDHFKAVASVVDRLSPPQTTVNVHHSHEAPVTAAMTEAVLKRIDELARKAGVLLPAPVIDAECKDVTPA